MYYCKILGNSRQRGSYKKAKEHKHTKQDFSTEKRIFRSFKISVMLLRARKQETPT